MENSERGIIIGTISCHDDDKDEINGQMSIYPQWFPEGNQNKYIIPFEIKTKQNNITKVKTYDGIFIDLFSFILDNNACDCINKWYNRS